MTLFGCPGVIPEWPFDQSYETAYAKIVPLRLKFVATIGPGAGSKAVGGFLRNKKGVYEDELTL